MKLKSMLLGAVAGTFVLFSGQAMADTSEKKIALSNNYAGNSWRQAMLESWGKVAYMAIEEGHVAAADAFTTSENQATEQAAQIQNMILQGYDAIVVNAASPTAINGAVKEACDAGITVVSFDGIVTEPCAWRIAVDFKQMGRDQVKYLAERYPEGGNLLEIRGLAGVFVDDEISAGIHEEVANTDFKIVGSVHGDWAQDVAQKAVAGILPSRRVATDTVRLRRLPQQTVRPRPSLWATVVMNWTGGKNRKMKMGMKPHLFPLRRVSARWRSGLLNRFLMATKSPKT